MPWHMIFSAAGNSYIMYISGNASGNSHVQFTN